MHGGSVSGGGNDESGASVEDGGTALKSCVLPIDGNGRNGTFPEALGVDVGEGGKSGGVELGRVKAAECDFTIILLVYEATKL